MTTTLNTFKSMVAFSAVPAGQQATLAHNLICNNVAHQPDEVKIGTLGFTFVSQTDTTITVQNDNTGAASCSVLCELWHPIHRLFGDPPNDGGFDQHLTPRPFVTYSGGVLATQIPVHSPVFTASFTAVAGKANVVTDAGVSNTATLPAASSVSNGTPLVIKSSHTNNAEITVTPHAGDTVDGQATNTIDGTDLSNFYVSDGVSNWVLVATAQP